MSLAECLLIDVDDNSFHEDCEATMWLRSRHLHLNDAVLRAFDAGNAGMGERLKLAGVPVPPGSLGGVVIAGEFLLAVGAGPLAPLGVFDVDVDLCRFDVQLHISHPPSGRKAQDLLVEIGVEHRKSLRGRTILPHRFTHEKPGWTGKNNAGRFVCPIRKPLYA